MPSIGVPELLIILFIIVVLFGARRLPELGGALGQSIKEFRKSTVELREPAMDTANAVARDSSPSQPAALAQGPAIAVPSKLCPACSSTNNENNTFCGQCGAKLT